MHHTNTYSCMTQMLWPSTLLFWYCKPPLPGWSTTLGTRLFKKKQKKNPSRGWEIQVRSERGGLNLKHTGLKQQKDTLLMCSCEINQSSHPACVTFSFFSFTKGTYLPHITHLVTPHSYSHAHSVYVTRAHMSSSYFLCSTAPAIRYPIIITFQPKQHKASLYFSVINNS